MTHTKSSAAPPGIVPHLDTSLVENLGIIEVVVLRCISTSSLQPPSATDVGPYPEPRSIGALTAKNLLALRQKQSMSETRERRSSRWHRSLLLSRLRLPRLARTSTASVCQVCSTVRRTNLGGCLQILVRRTKGGEIWASRNRDKKRHKRTPNPKAEAGHFKPTVVDGSLIKDETYNTKRLSNSDERRRERSTTSHVVAELHRTLCTQHNTAQKHIGPRGIRKAKGTATTAVMRLVENKAPSSLCREILTRSLPTTNHRYMESSLPAEASISKLRPERALDTSIHEHARDTLTAWKHPMPFSPSVTEAEPILHLQGKAR